MALLGANGAGKSTLAYLIMGCAGYRPGAGEIRFDGQALDALPIHQRARLGITLTWQEPARFEGLSVHDYLRLGAGRLNQGDPPDCLQQVGLSPTDYLPRMVDNTLSGGERKRIELASVIALNPRLTYNEGHYHGPYGGVSVLPKAWVKVGRDGQYRSDFSLTSGRVGSLDIDYEVEADAHAVVELTARIFGHQTDSIRIRERLVLAGEAARGLIKTRVAVEDDASAEIIGITEGNAAHARGHMDCLEIIRDRATASAQPVVRVSHPEAKITHEAAIGSVDYHQLETLMAHGLSPEAAVDFIVGGLLGQR